MDSKAKITKEEFENLVEQLFDHAADSVFFDVFYAGAEVILEKYFEIKSEE